MNTELSLADQMALDSVVMARNAINQLDQTIEKLTNIVKGHQTKNLKEEQAKLQNLAEKADLINLTTEILEKNDIVNELLIEVSGFVIELDEEAEEPTEANTNPEQYPIPPYNIDC